MRSVNRNKNINSEQKLLLLRGVPLAGGAPEGGDPSPRAEETPTCARNAPHSVPLFPKETPTPAYWGPHLVHVHKRVHVPVAPFVCPCFRVSAFGIWLKKSHSRALRAFRAAVRQGRPGCFDHLKKLNHLQPETCPGALPSRPAVPSGGRFPPAGLRVNAAEGIVPGQQLGQAGAQRNPLLERLPGAARFAAPLPQANKSQ